MSNNYGKADSWHDTSQALIQALPSTETAAGMVAVGVVRLLWHATKPSKILLQGAGKHNWVTEDFGETFKSFPSPLQTDLRTADLKIHPNRPDWILAKSNRPACSIDHRSSSCAADLHFSPDFGATWRNLTAESKGKIASFRDYDWGAALPKFNKKPTPDEAIFATVYLGNSGSHRGLYPGWDNDINYVVSLDLFKSDFAKIVPCGNLFEVVSHKVYLATPSDCPLDPNGKARKTPASSRSVKGRTVTMLMSDEDGDEFTESCLPVNLEDDGYNLVKTHDDYGVIVLADHAEPGSTGPMTDSPVSDAYSPSYNSSLYTVSLKNVYRRDYMTDFTRVEGLPGTFIANAVDKEALVPGTSYHHSAFMTSKLSTNGGSDWKGLKPPASYRFGVCNTCPAGSSSGGDDPNCRLHLHGSTSWFAPEGPRPNLYSVENAPGLVMAAGNVGAHLDFTPDADCTWLSRDGGLTWEDIYPATAIYEVGDKGGVMLIAPHRSEGPTDTLLLSLDEGLCWDMVKLPEALTVDNIRIDLQNSGSVFLVHGTACLKTEAHPTCSFTGGSAPPSKIFVIDVQELIGGRWRVCAQGSDSNDYESWQLPAPDVCMLGEKYTGKRRKRQAGCVNGGAEYKREPFIKEQCKCTAAADTECEYGFERGANATCVAIQGLEESACPGLKSNYGYKFSSTNLRLVHGDKCKELKGVIRDTDGRGGKSSGGGGGSGGGSGGGGSSASHSSSSKIHSFFIFLLVSGILAVVSGLIWSHCLQDGQRHALTEAAMPLLESLLGLLSLGVNIIAAGWEWASSKMGGFASRRRAEAAYFEPLAGGENELDLDPEDYRAPPLFSQGN